MDRLVKKYADKLTASGLAADRGDARPLVGGLDDEIVWNRKAEEIPVLEDVFKGLNINSLVFLRPAEPYAGIIDWQAQRALNNNGLIRPKDCETRTFLHDLPVIDSFSSKAIIRALKLRKSVIIAPGDKDSAFKGPAIAAHGTVSPEQGFVTTSSVCFASFVKFFTDYLDGLKTGGSTEKIQAVYDRAVFCLESREKLNHESPKLMAAPFLTEADVYSAIAQAGRKTVEYHLVDSYFGNVSCLWNHTLYISQTGSSLDELEGCVDPVPLDGSTSAGLTASSELSAHLETIHRTGCRAILHGHPKFAVILSMDCDSKEKAACPFKDQCHTSCPKKRFVDDIPIVPGEVGVGPTGLCNTLPKALETAPGAIVYGHGLFTTGKEDFIEAFQTLLAVEARCKEIYFARVKQIGEME